MHLFSQLKGGLDDRIRAVGTGMAFRVSRCPSDERMITFNCAPFAQSLGNKRILIFGGRSLLRLRIIKRVVNGSWTKSQLFDQFMTPVEAFFTMMRGGSFKNKKILTDKSSQRILRFIVADFLRSLSTEMIGFRTPGYIRDWILFYLSRTTEVPVRLRYQELMSKEHGLQSIFKAPGGLNIANIAVLFSKSESITIYISDTNDISDSEWDHVANAIAKIFELGIIIFIIFRFSWEIELWIQQQIFDWIFEKMPQSAVVGKRNATENTITFCRSATDDRKNHDDDGDDKNFRKNEHETLQERLKVMIQCLEREDAHYIEAEALWRHGGRIASILGATVMRHLFIAREHILKRRRLVGALSMQTFFRATFARSEYLKRKEQDERLRGKDERLAALEEEQRKAKEVCRHVMACLHLQKMRCSGFRCSEFKG